MTAPRGRATPVVAVQGENGGRYLGLDYCRPRDVEAALRVARQATGRRNALVCRGDVHAGSVLVTGVVAIPFPMTHRHGRDTDAATRFALRELDRVLQTISSPSDTAAIIVEPVLSEDGCVPATTAFMKGLRERADRHGFLLIIDEVRTGFGRTGRFWGHEHFGVTPDLLVTGEGPAASEELVRNAEVMGARLRAGLQAIGASIPAIGDVRGLGLMLATEFVTADGHPDRETAARVQRAALEQGLPVQLCGTWNHVVRMTPALVIDEAGVGEALRAWATAVAAGVWRR